MGYLVLTLVSTFLALCTASPSSSPVKFRSQKPAAFFLAGDSTTAVQQGPDQGGGWGAGFFGTVKNGALGSDYGHNGATTASFLSGGDWAGIVESTNRYIKAGFEVFVTIQFGHNDQKNTSGVTLEQYSANLAAFAQQIQSLNAHPILVTPLSRRIFSNGLVVESLATQRNLTIAVAKSINSSYIDLNAASTSYLNAIGQANATLYNLAPADFTHLNAAGSIVFGNLVSSLLGDIPGIGGYLKRFTIPESVIEKALTTGEFYLPIIS